MGRLTLLFTSSLSFLLLLVLSIFSFSLLLIQDYKKNEEDLLEKYKAISVKIISKQKNKTFNTKYLKTLDMSKYEILYEMKKINPITYNPNTKVKLEKISKKSDFIYRILEINSHNYIYFKKDNETLLIKDKDMVEEDSKLYFYLAFAILLSLIIILYVLDLKKVYMLKTLKEKIKHLELEHFDFECCNTKGKDEVSLLALQFRNSTKVLQQIKEERLTKNKELLAKMRNLEFEHNLAQNLEDDIKELIKMQEDLIQENKNV